MGMFFQSYGQRRVLGPCSSSLLLSNADCAFSVLTQGLNSPSCFRCFFLWFFCPTFFCVLDPCSVSALSSVNYAFNMFTRGIRSFSCSQISIFVFFIYFLFFSVSGSKACSEPLFFVSALIKLKLHLQYVHSVSDRYLRGFYNVFSSTVCVRCLLDPCSSYSLSLLVSRCVFNMFTQGLNSLSSWF